MWGEAVTPSVWGEAVSLSVWEGSRQRIPQCGARQRVPRCGRQWFLCIKSVFIACLVLQEMFCTVLKSLARFTPSLLRCTPSLPRCIHSLHNDIFRDVMEPHTIDGLDQLKRVKEKQGFLKGLKTAPVTALSNGVYALELPFAPEGKLTPTPTVLYIREFYPRLFAAMWSQLWSILIGNPVMVSVVHNVPSCKLP